MLIINSARLAAALIEAGLGEVELCVKAGVGHQTFAKMMKGKMVRFPSVSRICKALDLSPAEIVKEIPNETNQTQGQQELVSETRRHADKSQNDSQAVRLAVAGRIPS
jgi:DNA-binding Xre family transcriptional regulator